MHTSLLVLISETLMQRYLCTTTYKYPLFIKERYIWDAYCTRDCLYLLFRASNENIFDLQSDITHFIEQDLQDSNFFHLLPFLTLFSCLAGVSAWLMKANKLKQVCLWIGIYTLFLSTCFWSQGDSCFRCITLIYKEVFWHLFLMQNNTHFRMFPGSCQIPALMTGTLVDNQQQTLLLHIPDHPLWTPLQEYRYIPIKVSLWNNNDMLFTQLKVCVTNMKG